MRLTGPAAGDDLLKTGQDPSGRRVMGMLNNCAGGVTPWGTVLTGEENFDQYFANFEAVADPRLRAWYERYGFAEGASDRKWERYYDRFDLPREPHEAHRFGWVVEIDPTTRTSPPASTPRWAA
jgi:secreted PhoX family phosphatase